MTCGSRILVENGVCFCANLSIKNLERQLSPVEEFSQILERVDNFLHFILQTAPVVIGHQDKELKYRFIYNHFPSLNEEEIIGKTDVDTFTGAGVKESEDFKREVLERGIPAKREITFETELFGSKTFLIYVEPVFSKANETIGINYMGMDVTDQVEEFLVSLNENRIIYTSALLKLDKVRVLFRNYVLKFILVCSKLQNLLKLNLVCVMDVKESFKLKWTLI